METKRNEESDLLQRAVQDAPAAGVENPEESVGQTSASEVDDPQDAAQGDQQPDGETTDTPDATDPADPSTPAGSDSGATGTTGPSGGGDGGSGDGDDVGQTGGNGEPGDTPDGGEGEGEQNPPDNSEDKGGEKFEERFLTAPASGESADATGKRRESLAASLLRMALALLTGEIPEERFIPLMDATLAQEAIAAARAEGEIAGRNAIIEEQLVVPPVGAPDLNGAPIARSRRPATSIFDLADLAR